MAITSGYFNSVNGDRKYNADQMSEYFEGIINEGVCQHIDGGLAVTAGTGLSVNVAAGKAFIGKKWIRNDASLTLTISAASSSYARIDAVVLRRNNTTRTCQIVVKSGTPAASPVAPTMTRNSTTYEMALAYVNVAANATSVTVTDKRADTTVCGWATVAESVPGEIDAQLNAMKTGFDGVVYDSPAAMVQGEDEKIYNDVSQIIEELRIDAPFAIKNNYSIWISQNVWVPSSGDGYTSVIRVSDASNVSITGADSGTYYTFLKSLDGMKTSQTPDYATGYSAFAPIWGGATIDKSVPSDAAYLLISAGGVNKPKKVIVDGYNVITDIRTNIINAHTPIYVTSANYSTILPDLNAITDNNTYFLNFAEGSTSIPQNTPFDSSWGGYECILINYARQYGTRSAGDYQIFVAYKGKRADIYVRYYAGGWMLWKNIPEVNRIIVDKTGSGDYTTLRAGVEEAIKTNRCIVEVHDGTYDLCEEFYTELHSPITGQFGIKLENDVHIIFSSKAKVTAYYDGSDASYTTNFAPFFAGTFGGFILENLVIDATNTRYCVHDQFDYGTPRHVEYRNCRMYMDNTDAVLNYYPVCIGGGNGRCDDITIDNCYFWSKKAETEDIYTPVPLASYHNSGRFDDSLSHVRVSNSYFDGYGTFRVTYFGDSTNKSLAFVNNNSFGIPPIIKQELNGGTSPENWEMLAFMNEIRHPGEN